MEVNNPPLDTRILQDFLTNINQINKMLTVVREKSNAAVPQKYNHQHPHPQSRCIIITNSDTRQKMKHGEQFKELLDARDVVLEHSFNIQVDLNLQDMQQKGFLNSAVYQSITHKIKQFLVETLANILSVTFKNLNTSQLQLSEAKNYISSNIVLNIQSILLKTVQAVQQINDHYGLRLDIEQIRTNLIAKLQVFARDILINLVECYPSAPALGGTLRIKNSIKQINRLDDDTLDLIVTNDIKIANYVQISTGEDDQNHLYQKIGLRKDENYTDLIMEAINAAIRVVQRSYHDPRERANKEVFQEFMRELFALSQDESFRELVQWASPKQKITKQLNELKEQVYKQFSTFNEAPAPTIVVEERQKTDRSVSIIDNQKVSLKDNPQEKPEFVSRDPAVINGKVQKIIQTLKDYEIGTRIPNYVTQFSKTEIAQKRFSIKHPSVGRVITKWSEYFQQIFDDPETYVTMRLYNYKDIFNIPVSLWQKSHKEILIANLKKEAAQVHNKLVLLKNKTVKLLGDIIFKENDSFAQNVYRFSNTRRVSSKINAVAMSLALQYLSILIHHLLKAGQIFETYEGQKKKHITNVNLVVFKVNDLMRAKFKCSQGSFITIMKSLYILDEHAAMNNKFKLINIKNNLENSANNAVINFLFMGKASCELQLAVQQPKSKDKSYHLFSQMLQELVRNKLGIISSCAILIAKCDPAINSSARTYYEQKKQQQNFYEKQVKSVSNIYYCENEHCQQLVIDANLKLFKPGEDDILQKIDKNNLQVQKKLKEELYQHMNRKRLLKVNSYDSLKTTQQNYKICAKLQPRGKIQLYIVVNVKSQLKYFMVKVTPRVLVSSFRKVINFEEVVEYTNISKEIKEKRQVTDHLLFQVVELQATVQIFGFNSLNKQKLSRFAKQFESFRKQKNIIKAIKFKAEIIKCDQDEDKWQRFEQIMQVYAIDDKGQRERQIEEKLRYRRQKHLQFTEIKKVEANQCEIKELFKDMQLKCIHINQIIMRKNQLRNIYGLDTITHLHLLNLSGNKLQNVDGLSHLTQVHTLDLSYNQLLNVIGLKKLTNIDTLDLSCNPQLEDLDGLEGVTVANRMVCYRTFLTNITGLKNLKAINILDLRHNRLTNLDGLNSISNINTLYLNGNQLQNFEGLEEATIIDALDLRSNKLTNLQNVMKGLYNVSTINNIDLSRNQLNNIDDIESLNTIHALDISHNQLENIVCLKKFSTLTQLLVHNNKDLKIRCLPSSIQTLSANIYQLQGFDFSNCPHLRILRTDSENREDFKNLPKHVRLDKLYALF